MLSLSTVEAKSSHIIHLALNTLASDIHFHPVGPMTKIYFRIHGERQFYQNISNEEYNLLLAYYKFTSGMDLGDTRRPQNGMLTYVINDLKYALRLSTLPLHEGESLAIRILPLEEKLQLDQLLLFPSQITALKSWLDYRAGLILLTGPTGSGKSTTLYALLEELYLEHSYQVITLEDPIEKKLNHVLQVQLNPQAGITYQTGLKAALRHDPDILMVGEIRDKQTAHIAIEAALTGHLVFSTLHAKNAIGTIYRLLEMGIDQIDLQQCLLAVAAIELLPIEVNQTILRRAAILDLLVGDSLEKIMKGGEIDELNPNHSFEHLRKKAFAYGFISKQTYERTTFT